MSNVVDVCAPWGRNAAAGGREGSVFRMGSAVGSFDKMSFLVPAENRKLISSGIGCVLRRIFPGKEACAGKLRASERERERERLRECRFC